MIFIQMHKEIATRKIAFEKDCFSVVKIKVQL